MGFKTSLINKYVVSTLFLVISVMTQATIYYVINNNKKIYNVFYLTISHNLFIGGLDQIKQPEFRTARIWANNSQPVSLLGIEPDVIILTVSMNGFCGKKKYFVRFSNILVELKKKWKIQSVNVSLTVVNVALNKIAT